MARLFWIIHWKRRRNVDVVQFALKVISYSMGKAAFPMLLLLELLIIASRESDFTITTFLTWVSRESNGSCYIQFTPLYGHISGN